MSVVKNLLSFYCLAGLFCFLTEKNNNNAISGTAHLDVNLTTKMIRNRIHLGWVI